ncbi:MAG: DUF4177 domain-containing protein [Verrucomicrobiae bacterium]|nr:DUF4177 domain-containing protein [Verrucomicrobiae bacterium]
MDSWEYKTLVFETGGRVSRGTIDESEIERALNRWGSSGWEAVSVTPVSDGNVGTRRLLVLFKRRKTSRPLTT